MNYLELLKSFKTHSPAVIIPDRIIAAHLPYPFRVDQFCSGQLYSDRRLKIDITPLGMTESGIRIYSYRYTWSNDFTYVGVLAQDLLLSPLHKEAVTLESNGFYSVDYQRLGMQMITLSEWRESSDRIFIRPEKQTNVAA